MKRITSFALSLAMTLSVVAPVAASAQSMTMSSNFNYNLTVGNHGDAVIALQSFLVSKGLLTMPAGVAMGYFGGLTKSAVAAYQISKGIQPSAGYFGPITRAAVNADMAMGNNNPNPNPVAGCSAGAMYNSMTGASCNTNPNPTPSTSGVEGSLNINLSSTPSDNSNVVTQNDVPVYGLDFQAKIADVAVQTLDLQVAETNNSATENPSTLINTVKVWSGSTVIATVPVNSTTFTKDQNQVYYLRLSGLNFVVPVNTTKTLTISFSTNSIDNDRIVVLQGYNTSSVRAVSGNGISSFYSIAGSGYTRTHTFKKPGNSTLTLSASGTTLRSQNYRVNGTDTLQGVTLATFNLKSQTGDSTLLTVFASTTSNGTNPNNFCLYNGSTLVKCVSPSVNGSTTSATFNNLDSAPANKVANSDTPVTFTIKADFPGTTSNGTYASTTVNSVVYQNPVGNSAIASGSAVSNANQYVYTKAAVITLAGAPTITATNASVSGGTSTVTAVFPITICARGGNVILPGVSDGDAVVTFSNGVAATTANTVFTVIPANDISDGSCSTSATITAKSVGFAAGLYNAALTSIKWNAGIGTTTQTYGLEDFKTSTPANQQ